MRGRPRLEQPGYYDGPAIPLTTECQRWRLDAKLGSQILREACLDHFCQIANSNGLSLADVTADYANGRAPKEPGTERVYRGQAAERMAA